MFSLKGLFRSLGEIAFAALGDNIFLGDKRIDV